MPPAKPRGDKPADVTLNLDTLEREGEPSPFVVVFGGTRYVFRNIDDEDWRTLADIDESDPKEALKLLLGKEYDDFAEHELPVWKLRKLLDSWREHTTGTEAPEADASLIS